MIKYELILVCMLSMTLHMQADVDDKIQMTKKEITSKKSEASKLSKKLQKIAAEIEIEKVKTSKIINDIQKVKQEIEGYQKKSTVKVEELEKIEKLYQELTKKEEQVSRKVVEILSKEITIQMLMQSSEIKDKPKIYENDADSVVMNEIFATYSKVLREQFHKTKSKYIRLNKNILLIKDELKKLNSRIESLSQKQKNLKDLKTKRDKSIYAMDKKQKEYKKRLIRMQQEQDSLRATLNKLNITKQTQEEARKQREEEARRKREEEKRAAAQKEKTKITATDSNVAVRQIGSSYQKTKVVKYRGEKTTAPLKRYTITQKFGNFKDPIYNIKIFNESVIMKTKDPNAKVRSVLDGTVVYANATSMLDNVVIIKHKNNLHTIFAHLDKIAPTIKVGKKVSKGYVIGRVKDELTFEVTQNENHINPMDLIQ